MPFDDVLRLFSTIGHCHNRLKLVSEAMRRRADVKAVIHWFDIKSIDDGFLLEEYVDAELTTGEAVSLSIEITGSNAQALVTADVRRIHQLGQDKVADLGQFECHTMSEFLAAITRVAANVSEEAFPP